MTTNSTDKPDWSELDADVKCPLCDYNLRGLAEPRCPECGYQFVWKDLLDERERIHSYAFDAADRVRLGNVFKSFGASILPGRLWNSLLPSHRTRVGRLLVYLLLMWLPLGGAMGIWLASDAPAILARYQRGRNIVLLDRQREIASITRYPLAVAASKRTYGSVEAKVVALHPLPSFWREWHQIRSNRFWAGLIVSLPLLAFFPTLLVFQSSMRRRKVHWFHVLRCVSYSSWVMVLLALAVAAAIALGAVVDARVGSTWTAMIGLRPPTWGHTRYGEICLNLGIPAAALLMGWPLWMAYRRYLRFDHPFATIVSVEVIVLLIWAIVEVNVNG